MRANRRKTYVILTSREDKEMADTTYNVGIFCRLSNDDERDGESVSIENQKLLLQQYVRDRGWNEIDTYVDACVIIGLTGKTLAATGIAPF